FLRENCLRLYGRARSPGDSMRFTAAAPLTACLLLGGLACEAAPPPPPPTTQPVAAGPPVEAAAGDLTPVPEPPTAAHGPAVSPAGGDAVDADVRGRAPDIIRGIYLNAYAAGSTRRLGQLLALAERTEVNAFVVDVKDEKGIHYRTGVSLAGELAQPGEITIRDVGAFVDTLHAHGIYAIARIVAF